MPALPAQPHRPAAPLQETKLIRNLNNTQGIKRRRSHSHESLSATKHEEDVGTLDEDAFRRAFLKFPQISLISKKRVATKLQEIIDAFSLPHLDLWRARIQMLRELRAYVSHYRDNYEVFREKMVELDQIFLECIKSGRPLLMQEACITIAYLVTVFGVQMEWTAQKLLPDLINLSQHATFRFSSCGFLTVKFILQYVPSRILTKLILDTYLSSLSKDIRRACCGFLRDLLTPVNRPLLLQHLPRLQETVEKSLKDADQETRRMAPDLYHAYAALFPDQARAGFARLDVVSRLTLHERTAASQEAGQGVSHIATKRLPRGPGGLRGPEGFRGLQGPGGPRGRTFQRSKRRSVSVADRRTLRNDHSRDCLPPVTVQVTLLSLSSLKVQAERLCAEPSTAGTSSLSPPSERSEILTVSAVSVRTRDVDEENSAPMTGRQGALSPTTFTGRQGALSSAVVTNRQGTLSPPTFAVTVRPPTPVDSPVCDPVWMGMSEWSKKFLWSSSEGRPWLLHCLHRALQKTKESEWKKEFENFPTSFFDSVRPFLVDYDSVTGGALACVAVALCRRPTEMQTSLEVTLRFLIEIYIPHSKEDVRRVWNDCVREAARLYSAVLAAPVLSRAILNPDCPTHVEINALRVFSSFCRETGNLDELKAMLPEMLPVVLSELSSRVEKRDSRIRKACIEALVRAELSVGETAMKDFYTVFVLSKNNQRLVTYYLKEAKSNP